MWWQHLTDCSVLVNEVKITDGYCSHVDSCAACFLFPFHSSVVEHLLMMQWVFGSIHHGGLIGYFGVPAEAP